MSAEKPVNSSTLKELPTKAKPAPAAKASPPQKKTVRPFFFRRRHFLSVISFIFFVLGSSAVSFFYLYWIAKDQYISTVAFTVRSEEFQNPLDALGSLGQLSTGSSSDADILYDFISSQEIVENIRKKINLEEIYARPDYDPIFAYEAGQPIEDLVSYWRRMVRISYDNSAGLMQIDVYAFTPQDAYNIATLVVAESDLLINKLSQIAQEDRTRYSRISLEKARKRLTEVRGELSALRIQSQIVDPQVDLQSRMGVLKALQQRLADSLIREGALRFSASEDDPRIVQLVWEIDSLRKRISKEREHVLLSPVAGGKTFVEIIGKSESLLLETEFAQKSYVAAAAAYDTALAEAQRRSRYLATHIPPTLPESSLFPNRLLLWLSVTGFATLFWMIGIFVVYAARDRG